MANGPRVIKLTKEDDYTKESAYWLARLAVNSGTTTPDEMPSTTPTTSIMERIDVEGSPPVAETPTNIYGEWHQLEKKHETPAGFFKKPPNKNQELAKIHKAHGVTPADKAKMPPFIANQPGFKKAQAAVAAEQVTPRLDEEQMQDPREVDEYRRSIGKGAQFGTESDFIPKITQERRARNRAVKAFADKKKAEATALQERLDAPILEQIKDAEAAVKAEESWVHDESGMLVPNKDYTENRRWKAFKDSLTKEERRQNIREEQLAPASHWRTSAENLAIANQANVKDALINAGMMSPTMTANPQAPIVTPDTNYEFGVPAENPPESVRQAELLRKSWKGMKK